MEKMCLRRHRTFTLQGRPAQMRLREDMRAARCRRRPLLVVMDEMPPSGFGDGGGVAGKNRPTIPPHQLLSQLPERGRLVRTGNSDPLAARTQRDRSFNARRNSSATRRRERERNHRRIAWCHSEGSDLSSGPERSHSLNGRKGSFQDPSGDRSEPKEEKAEVVQMLPMKEAKMAAGASHDSS